MKRLIEFEKIDSTNNFLARNLNFLEDFTFVIAKYQQKGRGAGDNIWLSQANKNLLFSFVYTPFLPLEMQFVLSKKIAIAIVFYLKDKGLDAQIKWPNDILVHKKKICGILIENKIFSSKWRSIIGIGLNVNQLDFKNLNATSLKILLNKNFNIVDEFFLLKKFILSWLAEKDLKLIDETYLKFLFGYNQMMLFADEKKQTFTGKIIGIDKYGRLMIETGGQVKKFMTKQVRFQF